LPIAVTQLVASGLVVRVRSLATERGEWQQRSGLGVGLLGHAGDLDGLGRAPVYAHDLDPKQARAGRLGVELDLLRRFPQALSSNMPAAVTRFDHGAFLSRMHCFNVSTASGVACAGQLQHLMIFLGSAVDVTAFARFPGRACSKSCELIGVGHKCFLPVLRGFTPL